MTDYLDLAVCYLHEPTGRRLRSTDMCRKRSDRTQVVLSFVSWSDGLSERSGLCDAMGRDEAVASADGA